MKAWTDNDVSKGIAAVMVAIFLGLALIAAIYRIVDSLTHHP